MSKHRISPEVNAGSMADIAFLLLIFFLVTTTIETDSGLNHKLPSESNTADIKEKNLLRVSINSKDELLVEDELVDIQDLRDITIAFLDNGGIMTGNGHCDYCKGPRSEESSDNPQKAIVSLSNTRGTNYGVYIAVQNELVGAFNELRDREAVRLFNTSYGALMSLYNDAQTSHKEKVILKKRIGIIRGLFPQKISEAQLNTDI